MYPMVLDLDVINVSRSVLVKALQAEGIVGIAEGYANIHMLPMYQKKIAYGAKGFPWSADFCHRDVDYSHGICPVAEELHEKTYMAFPMCLHELSEFEIDLIIAAFHKVWAQLALLKNE